MDGDDKYMFWAVRVHGLFMVNNECIRGSTVQINTSAIEK